MRTLATAGLLLAATLVLAQAPATDPNNTSAALRIAVVPIEPLVIEEAADIYDGLAVAMWENVAARAELTYTYVDASADSAAGMLARGEVDLWLAATPRTGSRDTTSHSPIYYSSTMAVARRDGNSYVKVVRGLFQPAFFGIVAGLSVLLLIIGTIIYLIERKANEDEFGGKVHEGIGAGFWWAGVTLTTIGYGDKAPKTFAGRAVAMLWMLVGLGVSATLTAAIVSLASGDSARLKLPDDLRGERNVVLANGAIAPYFDRLGIDYETVATVEEGFGLVKDEKADFFAAPRMKMDHFTKSNSTSLTVQNSRLVPEYYAVGFRQNLPQADTISVLVSDVITSAVWPKWLDGYVPESER